MNLEDLYSLVGNRIGLAYREMMTEISVDEETIERLDALRIEDERYDEIIDELINIYKTEELTLFKTE